MAVDWSKRGEYIAKHNVTPAMADEAVSDAAAVVIDPDYNSRSGRGVRTIGYSRTFGDVLVVLTVEHDGIVYGTTAFRAEAKDRRYYLNGGME